MLGAPPGQADFWEGRLPAGIDSFLIYSQARDLPFLLSSSPRAEQRSALQLRGTTPGSLLPEHLVPTPWGSASLEPLVPRPLSRMVPGCPLLSWRSCVSSDVLPSCRH